MDGVKAVLHVSLLEEYCFSYLPYHEKSRIIWRYEEFLLGRKDLQEVAAMAKRRRIEATSIPGALDDLSFIEEHKKNNVRLRLKVIYSFSVVVMDGSVRILVCESCLGCSGFWKTWDVEVKGAGGFESVQEAKTHLKAVAPLSSLRFFSWDDVEHIIDKKTELGLTFFETMDIVWGQS